MPDELEPDPSATVPDDAPAVVDGAVANTTAPEFADKLLPPTMDTGPPTPPTLFPA